MMKHLKLKQEALIILVVDMCDLPGSIYSELPKIIGYQKPMIVVGMLLLSSTVEVHILSAEVIFLQIYKIKA